jgi:hypothetical protein
VGITGTDARPDNIRLSRISSDNGLKKTWIDIEQFYTLMARKYHSNVREFQIANDFVLYGYQVLVNEEFEKNVFEDFALLRRKSGWSNQYIRSLLSRRNRCF